METRIHFTFKKRQAHCIIIVAPTTLLFESSYKCSIQNLLLLFSSHTPIPTYTAFDSFDKDEIAVSKRYNPPSVLLLFSLDVLINL